MDQFKLIGTMTRSRMHDGKRQQFCKQQYEIYSRDRPPEMVEDGKASDDFSVLFWVFFGSKQVALS